MKKLKIKQNKLNVLLVIIGHLAIYGALYIGSIAFIIWMFLQNTIY